MHKYSIVIELNTDKEMSLVEKSSLISRLYLELTEPEVEVQDDQGVSSFDNASWSSVGEVDINIFEAK